MIADGGLPESEQTPFANALHQVLRRAQITEGEWTTYGDLAWAAGSDGGGQAVGRHLRICVVFVEEPKRTLDEGGLPNDRFQRTDPKDHRKQRELLTDEGIRWINGRADKSQRVPRERLRVNGLTEAKTTSCPTCGLILTPDGTCPAGCEFPVEVVADELDPNPPDRGLVSVNRIQRRRLLAKQVVNMYDHQCQICSTRLESPLGPIAIAAHIRGLGSPHNGPDELGNMLCLCPNCHVLFDAGGLRVTQDLLVLDWRGHQVGQLTVTDGHSLGESHLNYHRSYAWLRTGREGASSDEKAEDQP